MAGSDGRGCFLYQTVAVILVLCFSVPPLTCFSLPGLNENVKQDKLFGEATVTEVRTGIVLFNGKELHSRSWSASAAAKGSDGLLHIDSHLSDGTGMLEKQPPVKGTMVNEATWRHMKPSLQCGGDQMKFRVVGPGASQFTLEQENAPPMPLSQVPSSCGYSMQRNALALVLLVPYDGCSMVQEGKNYVLPLLWRGIPISLCCPNLMAHTPTMAAPTSPAKKPEEPKMPAFYPHMFPYFQPPPPVTIAAQATKEVPASIAAAPVTPATTAAPVTKPAAPTTAKPIAPVKKPEMPVYPQFPAFYPHMFPYFQPPPPAAIAVPASTVTPAATVLATTAAPPTTTKTIAPVKRPEMPVYPQFPVFYPPMFPYFQPPPAPATVLATTAAPTTIKPTAPVKKPEMPVYPQFPVFYPPMFPYFQPPPPAAIAPATTEVPATAAAPTTKSTTTKSTTTTTAKPSETDPHPQMFPFPFPPYIPQYRWPFPESLLAMSKLEFPGSPPHMAAFGQYPHYIFPPYALPASTQNPPPKPEPASPTTIPTAIPEKPERPLAPSSDPHPQGRVAVEFFPFGNPFGPSPF